MNTENFTVTTGAKQIRCTLALPSDKTVDENSGLLVNISATSELALFDETQNHPTQPFLDAGHYVVSVDLPHHGERVSEKHGEGLPGMGRAYKVGEDPFEQFVRDGKAVLSACLERGIAANGKIVSYGVSRAGYCLLRLAAADVRLRAVAALSPVTDWGIPEEFIQNCPHTHTGPLRIEHWVDELAETAIYLSVGSQDDIVGTRACVDFGMRLFELQRRKLPKDQLISQLHVVDSPAHSPSRKSRLQAIRFLLDFCQSYGANSE